MSPYVSRLNVEGSWVLVHVGNLERLVLDPSSAAVCDRLEQGGISQREFVARCGSDGERLFELLLRRQFVLPDVDGTPRSDGLRPMRDVIAADPGSSEPTSAGYWDPRPLGRAARAAGRSQALESLRVLAIGGCVLQFAEDSLVSAGFGEGYDIRMKHCWPSADAFKAAADWKPDLTIFQPTIQPYISGLLDDGPFRDADARGRRLRAVQSVLGGQVEELAEALNGRLGLIHNLAPPAVSAFGRFDFRQRNGFRGMVAEINARLDQQVAQHDNLMVLDEERLVVRHGAVGMFDELVFPFGHHGGAPDPAIDRPNQRPMLSDVLADEYVACYQALAGVDRVRMIAVDLDGTLWPGIVADDGFGWLDEDTTARWLHLGLHQALRLLASRGILLVSCSLGTEQATIGPWREVANRALLSPDEFVAHCIDWQPKPEKLAQICRRLGVAPRDVLVLDDDPLQRAELRSRLPAVRVLEGPVHAFRGALLTDPRCEPSAVTAEARRRTETVRLMAEREELLKGANREEFLEGLEVVAEIRPADPADLVRVAELIGRTNQFNTSGRRIPLRDLQALQGADGAGVAVMFVRDRFADYGLVGAMVIEGHLISVVAVSCRVISLDVAARFVTEGVAALGMDLDGVRGLLVETDRNEPARDVFSRAGVRQVSPGHGPPPAWATSQ